MASGLTRRLGVLRAPSQEVTVLSKLDAQIYKERHGHAREEILKDASARDLREPGSNINLSVFQAVRKPAISAGFLKHPP